jgi:Tol biopolymer transport system component
VTPDGRYLVWSDFEPNVNLALRDVATGENRFLTHDGRINTPWANSYSARISPDGNWVAHGYSVQDDAGSLRVVGIDGENLREIRKEKGCWVHLYDWTSDGEYIAARWACWSDTNPQGTFKMVMVSVADGSAREVHELPNVRTGFRAWLSPDDRYLVFGGPVEQDDGNSDIWILPLSGGDEVPLIEHPADDRLLGWVPGTDRIVFLSDRLGTWDLWAAGVRDGTIVEPPRRLQRDLGEVGAVGFSESGSLFYSVFTRWFSTSMAPFDVATGKPDLDAAIPLLGSNRGPRWSPDGQLLAFATESELTEGKYGRINIRDLTTGEQRELATHIRARQLNDWSPDGGSLLLGGDDGRDEPHIWKVDVSSGEGTPLLPVPDAYEWWGGWTWADWSPDGKGILYSVLNDGAGQGRLARRDLASGEEQELYRDSLLIRRPFELSPDGRQVAFVFMDSLNADGPGGLAVLDLDTRITRRIVAFGDSVTGWEVSLQWTPEGTKIVYSETLQGDAWDEWHTNVYRVAATGGDPEYLWTFANGKWGGWFELSPDSRQIALTTYTQETEIWVMENLREVLERQR